MQILISAFLLLYAFLSSFGIAPNPPFEDELMKKAIQVIMSSFQALPDSADKSYHKRVRILESMSRVMSYVVLLDLECRGHFPQSFSISKR